MHNYIIGCPLMLSLIQCIAFIEPSNDSHSLKQQPQNILVNEETLEYLCQLFNIPQNQCTCELFDDYCPETQGNISTINSLAC